MSCLGLAIVTEKFRLLCLLHQQFLSEILYILSLGMLSSVLPLELLDEELN